jgi:hypothetical protein
VADFVWVVWLPVDGLACAVIFEDVLAVVVEKEAYPRGLKPPFFGLVRETQG